MTTYDIVCMERADGIGLRYGSETRWMRALVIDKVLVQFDLQLPGEYGVFTTPNCWRLAVLPMVTGGDKPTRIEALKYYRKGAEHYGLELRLFEKVLRVEGQDGAFTV